MRYRYTTLTHVRGYPLELRLVCGPSSNHFSYLTFYHGILKEWAHAAFLTLFVIYLASILLILTLFSQKNQDESLPIPGRHFLISKGTHLKIGESFAIEIPYFFTYPLSLERSVMLSKICSMTLGN